MHWNDRYVLAYFVQFSAAIAVCLAYIPIKGLVEVIAGVLLILSLPWVMFNSIRPLLPLPHDIRRGAVAGVTVLGLRPSAALYCKNPEMAFDKGKEPDVLSFIENPPIRRGF